VATVTLIDNEIGTGSSSSSTSSTANAGTIGFSAAAYGIGENENSVTITVNRTGGTKGAVSVAYATSDSTASSGRDYSSTSGTLNFADGESSKTFAVAVTNNSSIEGNRTVNLVLSGPTGGVVLGSPSSVPLTISDDETLNTATGGMMRFSQGTYTVAESDGKAVITVQRITGDAGTVSVQYATSNGTAFSGSDFTSTSGTLTFAPGEIAKTFTVPLIPDTQAETEETVTLTLSNPTGGAALGDQTTATLKISG
jgi:hypothetical protein